jgi:hypothetical protein
VTQLSSQADLSPLLTTAQDAARKIGIGNSDAENLKSLLPAQQDIAATESWRPPNIYGSLLQGGGNLLGSYSGTHVSPKGAQLPFGPAACSRLRRLRCSASLIGGVDAVRRQHGCAARVGLG